MAARDWYIAWLGTATEAFDPVAHKRVDLDWTTIDLVESEGADATAVTIGTARMSSADLVGKRWAMLSFEHPDGTIYPVARMKRMPIPAGSREGELTLKFEAGLLPGWKDLRDAGLAALKNSPAYAAILVSPTRQSDPTEILDGHRRIGHHDRVTGAYSTPELLGQGLPSKTFTPDDWVGWERGGITIDRSAQPILGVQLTIAARWMQILEGLFDASGAIADLFPDLPIGARQSSYLFKGEFDPSVTIAKGAIATLTPDELVSGWPKPGASLGGQSGYTVVASSLTKTSNTVFAGPTQPTKAGPVKGSRRRYVDYTVAGNPDDATNIALDITYFLAQLVVAYSCRQQREETLSVLIPNGACTDPEAPVRELALHCEDPTVDTTTTPWLPVTHYLGGDVRRFGWYSWISQKEHVSGTSFAADVQAGKWKVAPQNASYIGGPSGNTFFPTVGGTATLVAGVMKALKIIALSQRTVGVEWSVPFEDVVGMSTAWHARIEADDLDLPGGFAEGKVVSFRVRDSASADGWPQASIRIASCDGTGEAAPDGGTRVGYVDQPWDIVSLSGFTGYPPPDDPAIGGSANVTNNVAQQLAYVQANDYVRGDPLRGDQSKADPKTLLRQVPMRIGFSLAAINGGPTLQHFIPAVCTPWHGPRQCAPPSI